MRYLWLTARPVIEDLAGTLAFLLLYEATGSAVLSALVGLALGFVQLGWHLLHHRRVPMVLALGVALTVVLGGLTLVTNDPRFALAKPSIIYAVIGASMLTRGWVVRYAPEIVRPLLPAAMWDRVGWTWAGLMFLSAGLNLILLAAMAPRPAAAIFTGWAIGSKLLLFLVQYVVIRGRAIRAYRASTETPA